MKSAVYALALMVILTAATAFAQSPAEMTPARATLIEKNICANLTHPSDEVKGDAIQLVIDLKNAYPTMDLDYAIIPLMSVLKHDTRDELRILSALALRTFDSDRARFAVSQRARFDESPRVARHCSRLMRDWNQGEEMVPVASLYN